MVYYTSRFLEMLQMFADGASGSAGGTGGDGTTGVTPAAAGQGKGVKGNTASVVYGKQDAQVASAQEPEGKSEVSDDRQARFEAMIKGEFHDLYDARVSDTVQKRLKGSKETIDKYEKLTPTLELLARKYGIKDASDVAALSKAIEEDDSYYEDEAYEKGISVEQLKEIKKMERENAELREAMTQQKARENAERDVARWMEEARDAAKRFPSLNLRQELNNPQFISLLKSGVGVETAYFAMHHQELVPEAMKYGVKTAEQKLTAAVRANGSRPAENGAGAGSTVVYKSDVSQLTKADRQEIARRVARGEKIKF